MANFFASYRSLSNKVMFAVKMAVHLRYVDVYI